MKKTLLFLLTLALAIAALVSCGKTNEENTPNYERPDYGTATVYAPGDSLLLISTSFTEDVRQLAEELGGMLERGKRGGVTIGSAYSEDQELELIITSGREDIGRDVVSKAWKYLDRIEKDSYFTMRYAIYADSGKIAICYEENDLTNIRMLEILVKDFMKKYVSGKQYIALPSGVIECGSIDLKEKQEQLDAEYLDEKWNELEAAAKEKYGEGVGAEITRTLKVYYSMFSDKVVDWWANLYDPGIGAFYSTSSGRDHLGYLPAIEGNCQLISQLETTGMLDTLGGDAAYSLPDLVKYRMVYYLKSLQNSSNGYFYNPQLGIEGTTTYRLGRDQGRCTTWLKNFGSAPTYYHPNGTRGDGITADEYWDDLVARGIVEEAQRPFVPKSLEDYEDHLMGALGEESAAVAVSRIVTTASTSDASQFLANHNSFAVWLEALDIDGSPYSACSNINATYNIIASASDKLGPSTDSSKWYYGMTLKEMVIHTLNIHINGKGLFGAYAENSSDPYAGCKFANTNGLMKAIPIYSSWGIAYPEPVKAIEGCLIGIQSDEESVGNICNVYNIWSALSGVLANVKKYGTEEERAELFGYENEDGEWVTGTIYTALGSFGPDAIINSFEKQRAYQCPDGGFSHSTTGGVKANGGCPVGLGLHEANVDANGFGMQSIVRSMLSCFDLLDYFVPIYTESDWMRFLEIINELDPVIKYSYSDETNGAIDKVFTFDEELPSSGLTIKKTNSGNGNTHSWSGALGKDGKAGVLRIDKPVNGSYTNPVMTMTPNTKSYGATMVTLEMDIKISNLTASSNIEINFKSANGGSGDPPTRILLTPTGLEDGSAIKYVDYNNGASAKNSFETPAKIGEWFTLRIEYYEGTVNTFRTKTYINDELIYTSNSILNQAMYAAAEPIPDAYDIREITFGMNANFKGVFEFDNISFTQSSGSINDMGVGRPGATVIPDERAEEPEESIPDLIPEGIKTPASSDAISFDSMPATGTTNITANDYFNVYYITSALDGGKVLYIDKPSSANSSSAVTVKQSPTKNETKATVAIFETDIFISGYDATGVIQFTAHGGATSADAALFMITLKPTGNQKGSILQLYNSVYDEDSAKTVDQNSVNTEAAIGNWFRLRIEYAVTAISDAGSPSEIEYKVFINNELLLTDTRAYGSALVSNGGTTAIPSVDKLSTVTISIPQKTCGRFAFDNTSFRKLSANDYAEGELDIPDYIIGSGFDEPEGSVTFSENYKDILARDVISEDIEDGSKNAFAVVSKNGMKMLSLEKTDITSAATMRHNLGGAAGSFDRVVYETALSFAPTVGEGGLEALLLGEDGEQVLRVLLCYGEDGALGVQTFRYTSEGVEESDIVYPKEPARAGDFFKLRIEHTLGATEKCTEIYINGELLITGAYYTAKMTDGVYTGEPHTSAKYAAISASKELGCTVFIDYSYVKVGEATENTLSFDKPFDEVLSITYSTSFGNSWEIVTVEDEKKLLINKPGVDTVGSYSGMSLKLNVTEREANAQVMVMEFDLLLEDVTATNNQFTMGHQGVSGKNNTPFLVAIAGLESGNSYHIVLTYRVTAADGSGAPTDIEYAAYVNGGVSVYKTKAYTGASNLVVNGGTLDLPRVDQVESVTFALNNAFCGKAYIDNMRLALLASYEPPHKHVYVDGKCECGAEDPDYVPEHTHVFVEGKCECGAEDPDYVPTEATLSFDKPFDEVLSIIYSTSFGNSWEIVTVEDEKKLLINKPGVDTVGTNSGVSLKLNVTEREANAQIMVMEFDLHLEDVTATANQFTMGHQGVSGKKNSPFVAVIAGLESENSYHIVLTYRVTAVDEGGAPTDIEYAAYVNGEVSVLKTKVSSSATNLKVNGGTLDLPRVDQVESVTFSLNNAFCGKAYIDNMRLALLASYELPR